MKGKVDWHLKRTISLLEKFESLDVYEKCVFNSLLLFGLFSLMVPLINQRKGKEVALRVILYQKVLISIMLIPSTTLNLR